jgi:hypothetical protein
VPLFVLALDDSDDDATGHPVPTAPMPVSPRGALAGERPEPPGDHRSDLVRALADGAARAFAAGDTRAALLALDTVRALVGDAAQGPAAAVLDLETERRRRER